ncbi:MAG TPA: hypothetical protein VGY56_17385 [Verrucomicrobiae bacterium]|nr:hypothetical protein [Verrucomicrobiae bacterium]
MKTQFDNDESLRQAEAKMPMERLIREFGHGPKHEDGWKAFQCPFCKKEDKAGVFTAAGNGTKLFKCMSSSCEGNTVMPVVKLFMRFRGITDGREGFIEYLKLAGVWQDVPRRETEVSFQATNGDGYAALREFYSRLTLLPRDEHRIFQKRGLVSATVEALGFKSNQRANRRLLLELGKMFSWDELKASGLWIAGKDLKTRRPNSQFCGCIQLARKPKNQRKSADDKSVWGWCDEGWCPKCERASIGDDCSICGAKLKSGDAVLIPYFNPDGELIALRPHKGGAPEGTAASTMHIYVPREPKSAAEHFHTVIVTEGEFKAAALCQTIGAGRTDGGKPVGVSALPGIYFARHWAVREELNEWLETVQCRRVIVAYDYEDKGNPAFGDAYQPEMRKRFDSQIWARFLATDLSKKLHIRGEVIVLPAQWQTNGKADWDGALAKFAQAA